MKTYNLTDGAPVPASQEFVLVGRDGLVCSVAVDPAAAALLPPPSSGEDPLGKSTWRYLQSGRMALAVADAAGVEDGVASVIDGRCDHYARVTPGTAAGQWVEISAMALTGGTPGALLMRRDVTRARQTEETLRIDAAALTLVQGIMIGDRNKVIIRVNRAFCDISGYEEQEAIGQSTGFLKSGWHDQAFYQLLWSSIDSTGSWQGEIWNRRKNGEVYPAWLSITVSRDQSGAVTHYVGALRDISRHKSVEDELKHLTLNDPLTRLPNRRLLLQRLAEAQTESFRSDRHAALLLIDFDGFRQLNDSLSHAMGDLVLQQAADRLTALLRGGDMVARLGGDQFAVILVDLYVPLADAIAETGLVGNRLMSALGQPFDLGDHPYSLTASCGIALFNDARQSTDQLLKMAEFALQQAKAAGRNMLRFHDAELQAALHAQMTLDADLRQAMRAGQFYLAFQAQIDESRRVVGAEALLRWRHPVRGIVPPGDFIPRAEANGLILPIGLWVLREACRQLALWAADPQTAPLTMAVNVSSRQFRQPDFVDQVKQAIADTGADPGRLELELTESLLIDNVETVIEKMTSLRGIGIRFSLDDFGTGFSSLAYLKRLPFAQLKIDQCFVAEVLSDPNDAAIVQTIIELGRRFGISVIAEGVETEEQLGFLAGSGCKTFQGYLCGRPGSAEELLSI